MIEVGYLIIIVAFLVPLVIGLFAKITDDKE